MPKANHSLLHPLAWLALGLAELALAYGFISLAFDRGGWWWYILTIIFFVLGVKNIVNVIGAVIRGRQS